MTGVQTCALPICGISSLQDAEDFMALGADRLGTSRIVKLVKGEHAEGY